MKTNVKALMKIVREQMPRLPYHNPKHALDTYKAAKRIAREEHLKKEETLCVETAALLHDAIFVLGAKENEAKAAKLARSCLPKLGYTQKQVKCIAALIRATKIPTHPKNLLEKIVCDADLDNLGRKDFFKKNDAVRREWGRKKNREWWRDSVHFLQQHTYYTKAAQKRRREGKEKNIKILQKKRIH